MKINEEPVVRTASGVQVVFFSCKNFSFKKTHTHTHTHIYIYKKKKTACKLCSLEPNLIKRRLTLRGGTRLAHLDTLLAIRPPALYLTFT